MDRRRAAADKLAQCGCASRRLLGAPVALSCGVSRQNIFCRDEKLYSDTCDGYDRGDRLDRLTPVDQVSSSFALPTGSCTDSSYSCCVASLSPSLHPSISQIASSVALDKTSRRVWRSRRKDSRTASPYGASRTCSTSPHCSYFTRSERPRTPMRKTRNRT